MKAGLLYKKMVAALLLCVLLFTTIVQLAHSHTATVPAADKIKKAVLSSVQEQYSVPAKDASCFLCDYQLTKDAEFPCLVFQVESPLKLPAIAYRYREQVSSLFPYVFESRGPPSVRFV